MIEWMPMFAVGLATGAYGVGRSKYRTWKTARTDIGSYPNWRGVYVEDLKVKRFERGALIAVGVFMICVIAIFLAI